MQLPADIIRKIALHLQFQDLCNWILTCKLSYSAISWNEKFWENLFYRDLGSPKLTSGFMGYKKSYLQAFSKKYTENPKATLMWAIDEGYDKILLSLRKRGFNPNYSEALGISAENGHIIVFKILYADFIRTSYNLSTYLIVNILNKTLGKACSKCQFEIYDYLIIEMKMNSLFIDYKHAITSAALNQQISMIVYINCQRYENLIEAFKVVSGVYIDSKNSVRIESAMYLSNLIKKINRTIPSNLLNRIFSIGLFSDNFDQIKIAVENGASVNMCNHPLGSYTIPILSVVKTSRTDIIEYLAKKGADLNVENGEPLHIAVCNEDFKVVKLLIKLGANPHIYNDRVIEKAKILYSRNKTKISFEIAKYLNKL